MTSKAVVTSDYIDGVTLRVVGGLLVVDDTSKIPLSLAGVANGVATLGSDGRVLSGQLPSYMDQVLEYSTWSALPSVGIAGVLYVTTDTNAVYRWSGSTYIEIVASPGTTDNVPEGTTNLYHTPGRSRASISAGAGLSYNAITGVMTGPNLSAYAPINNPTFTGTVNATNVTYSGVLTGGTSPFNIGSGQIVKDAAGQVGFGMTPVAANGVLQLGGFASVKTLFEAATIGGMPGTSIDLMTSAVVYYTTSPVGNWTTNLRGAAGVTLNSIMGVGQSCCVTYIVLQGSTPSQHMGLYIDGNLQSMYWQGGVAPAPAAGINVYSFVIIKWASSSYTCLGAQTNFT